MQLPSTGHSNSNNNQVSSSSPSSSAASFSSSSSAYDILQPQQSPTANSHAEKALSELLARNQKHLRAAAQLLLDSILSSVDHIPSAVRYAAYIIRRVVLTQLLPQSVVNTRKISRSILRKNMNTHTHSLSSKSTEKNTSSATESESSTASSSELSESSKTDKLLEGDNSSSKESGITAADTPSDSTNSSISVEGSDDSFMREVEYGRSRSNRTAELPASSVLPPLPTLSTDASTTSSAAAAAASAAMEVTAADAVHNSLSSFFFLRFLCPALVTPVHFGLIDSKC